MQQHARVNIFTKVTMLDMERKNID